MILKYSYPINSFKLIITQNFHRIIPKIKTIYINQNINNYKYIINMLLTNNSYKKKNLYNKKG